MICITWDGFPQYAARCVRAFVNTTTERVVLVATRPSVPIRGMDDLCGCQVIWVTPNQNICLKEIFGEIPRLIFLSGWSVPIFERFRVEVKKMGGCAVLMSDRNWALSNQVGSILDQYKLVIVELLRSIRFKMFFRDRYDAFFVPGNSGVKLLQSYGVPSDKIFKGMYAADNSLFYSTDSLDCREKKIIYVGRFVTCKNVLRMVDAFVKAVKGKMSGWSLILYGSGPLKKETQNLIASYAPILKETGSSIQVNDFVQPEKLAHIYRQARLFCLPSLSEPWGVVVHEAALSGCVLLLGNVGSSLDFLVRSQNDRKYVNGYMFNPYDITDMATAFSCAMDMSSTELRLAHETSLQIAQSVTIKKFAASMENIVEFLS